MVNPPSPLSLGPEGEEQYSLLLTALALGSGFELSFVTSQSRYVLDEVRGRILRAGHPGLSALDLAMDGPDEIRRLLARLLQFDAGGRGRHALVAYPVGTFSELVGAWTQALTVLNEQRNRLMRECPHYVLLFGPPGLPVLAQDIAPDVWSVRSMVFAFPEPPATQLAPRPLDGWTATSADEGLLDHQLRSGEYYWRLAQGLAGAARNTSRRSRFDLLIKAAQAWSLRGVPDRAESAAREAQAEADHLGDDRGRAGAASQIADILQSRGDLEEALCILRDEALPVFDRLGDVRSRAVTVGKIADILQSRGDLDEALRIRREEQLPVYDRLGDVRSRAVTMGRIADILQSRGDLDEALRIRREDELPVYDRLGDVRSLLVGRTSLAITLAQRGRPEDGAEIATLLASAHVDAVRLRLPEAGQIAGIFESIFGVGIEAAMRQAPE